MDQEVWICGEYISGEKGSVVWDFHGVFSSKEKAIAACRDRNYMVAPAIMDQKFPDERVEWPGAEYPLA